MPRLGAGLALAGWWFAVDGGLTRRRRRVGGSGGPHGHLKGGDASGCRHPSELIEDRGERDGSSGLLWRQSALPGRGYDIPNFGVRTVREIHDQSRYRMLGVEARKRGSIMKS